MDGGFDAVWRLSRQREAHIDGTADADGYQTVGVRGEILSLDSYALTPIGCADVAVGDKGRVEDVNLITGKLRVKTDKSEVPVTLDRSEVKLLKDTEIKVNREELLATLRRINVSTTPTTNAMRLNFENNLLTITVNSTDVEDATDTVTIKYDGQPISAVFNPEFMMEPLKNLTSDEVTIELNNATSPGLIKDDTSFLYVIMPLRI